MRHHSAPSASATGSMRRSGQWDRVSAPTRRARQPGRGSTARGPSTNWRRWSTEVGYAASVRAGGAARRRR